MIEYFQKTTLNGFGLLYYIRRRKYQRLLWFMFIFMGISFACFVVGITVSSFLADPTVTSLQTQHYEVSEAFPAVAVCSTNKLNRIKVEHLIQKISNHPNLTEDERKKLSTNSQLLAGYFSPSLPNYIATSSFENELDKLGLNVVLQLEQLSPSCEEILVECHWANRIYDCTQIFYLFPTVNGFCCIFNYERNLLNNSLYFSEGIGKNMGLDIILNASKSNHFYTVRSFSGFNIQIFDTNHFPDNSNGDLREIHLDSNQYAEVELTPIKQKTTTEARSFSVEKRNCYFSDEYAEQYVFGYSQSECLTRCKLRSMQSLCGCVPFYSPPEFIHDKSSVKYCNLVDAMCLDRYQITWNSYKPMDKNINVQHTNEYQEALHCAHCLPLCTYNRYEYRMQKYTYKPKTRKLQIQDLSRVTIFFQNHELVIFEKNVVYNWYQIMSSIGGVIGICMGCSLISGFEVIYFLSFRLLVNFYKLRQTSSA